MLNLIALEMIELIKVGLNFFLNYIIVCVQTEISRIGFAGSSVFVNCVQ